MIELKNCPFCGNSVDWCGESSEQESHECHQISCQLCKTQFDVDSFAANDAEGLKNLRQVIADVWNSRVNGNAKN